MSARKPGEPRLLEGFLKAKSLAALWPGGAVRVVDTEARTRGVWEVREPE